MNKRPQIRFFKSWAFAVFLTALLTFYFRAEIPPGSHTNEEAGAGIPETPTPTIQAPVIEAQDPEGQRMNPRFVFNDIPDGDFRTAFLQLPPALQKTVGDNVVELDIPHHDFESLRLHPEGRVFYVCDFGGGLPRVDENRKSSGEKHSAALAVVEPLVFTNTVSISAPPLFHSRPGSTNILFLDFNGHLVTNTYWNTYPGYEEPSWDCRPYCIDNDETTFSIAEQQAIQTIWERVAEDYAPFDIDVTTEQPPTWNRYTGHVLITPDTDKNGVECPHFDAGGVAFVDVFGDADYSYDYPIGCLSPAWVLNYEQAGYAEFEAEAASHEMGHNLALSHDGTKKEAYYDGHESGSISWAPIMGAGYNRNMTQWSKGDYRMSNNTEDDLAILESQLGYRPDDFGDDPALAGFLALGPTGSVYQTGVVEKPTDIDVFQFVTLSGRVEIAVSPYQDSVSTTWGGNLDVVLELYDADGVLLATENPELEAPANLSAVVSNGVYYLHVKSTGVGNPLQAPAPTGYLPYGSLGQYVLNGNIIIDPDLDGDGLPNTWEVEYFSDLTNAVTSFDADGDGQNNLAEFISGFDPTNTGSVFTMNGYPVQPSNKTFYVVSWEAKEGRLYNVTWSDSLQEAPFSNLVENLAYPRGSYTDRVDRAGASSFYRIDVRLAE